MGKIAKQTWGQRLAGCSVGRPREHKRKVASGETGKNLNPGMPQWPKAWRVSRRGS